ERAFAYPLSVGAPVPLQGRVKECVGLVEPGHWLLDLVCSPGRLSPYVLSKGYKGYVGMDRVIVGSPDAVDRTLFVEGSASSLPFCDGSFDAACLFDVIEHLPRKSEHAALREVNRVLRRDGKLYFS